MKIRHRKHVLYQRSQRVRIVLEPYGEPAHIPDAVIHSAVRAARIIRAKAFLESRRDEFWTRAKAAKQRLQEIEVGVLAGSIKK